MKIALVHAVRVGGAEAYGWKWRSEDGSVQSTHAYAYFYDCCENARRKGFEWRFEGAADGSASPAVVYGIAKAATARPAPARRR